MLEYQHFAILNCLTNSGWAYDHIESCLFDDIYILDITDVEYALSRSDLDQSLFESLNVVKKMYGSYEVVRHIDNIHNDDD